MRSPMARHTLFLFLLTASLLCSACNEESATSRADKSAATELSATTVRPTSVESTVVEPPAASATRPECPLPLKKLMACFTIYNWLEVYDDEILGELSEPQYIENELRAQLEVTHLDGESELSASIAEAKIHAIFYMQHGKAKHGFPAEVTKIDEDEMQVTEIYFNKTGMWQLYLIVSEADWQPDLVNFEEHLARSGDQIRDMASMMLKVSEPQQQ